MRLPRSISPHSYAASTALLTSLLLPVLVTASSSGDCSPVLNKKKFNLQELGGPHCVSVIENHPPNKWNTTYTLDICKPLTPPKDGPKDEQCEHGTRVCGIQRNANDLEEVIGVYPIAGDYTMSNGHHFALDARWSRLTSSDDMDKDGLRVEFHGGHYPTTGNKQKKLMAIIDFICDPDRTGLDTEHMQRREEGEDEEKQSDKDLVFVRKEPLANGKGDTDSYLFEWKTKYACEDQEGEGSKSKHWGFFTWFIIILFMATATYLIFGSWLNYNRYGARGWDLLPHGDTIRDIPYLLRDWTRRVVNTVQGGGSRGGYSAV